MNANLHRAADPPQLSNVELISQTLASLQEIRSRSACIDSEKLDTLLSYIEEGEVIPIVGQQLLTVGESSTTVSQLLAQTLAAELRVQNDRLPLDFALSDVISAYKPFATDRKLIYKKLNTLLKTEPFRSIQVPKPLRQLALIRDFRIFVTTTFGGLLDKAINLAWFGSEGGVQVRAFSPYTPCDLEENDILAASPPVIFKLFGEVSEHPYFAATDADVVEFLHKLQSDKRPSRLFGQLKNSHLLILGTYYPNWLARFFLRITKDEILWVNREKQEYWADGQLGQDPSLVSFIRQFSKNTECFHDISAAAFVERLFAEWLARNQDRALAPPRPAPSARIQRFDECVFVSYASEDTRPALRIKDALESIGWSVWFDRKDLGSGTEYESHIEKVIRAAQAFVVVLSESTSTDQPRFFRQEWLWALERQRFFTGLDRRFIHPLRLTQNASIPDNLSSYNALDAFDGEPVQAFMDDMTKILRRLRKERR